MRMYPAVIYLLKVGNENCRTRCVIISKLTKTKQNKTKHQNHHNHMRTLRNIGFTLVSLYLFLVFILELPEVFSAGFTSNQSTDK